MSFLQSSFHWEKKTGKAGFAIRLFIREETSPGCIGGGGGGRGGGNLKEDWLGLCY